MTDVPKYISGCLASLSAMVQLELPHVNILSKMDLVTDKKDVEKWVIIRLCFSCIVFYCCYLWFLLLVHLI